MNYLFEYSLSKLDFIYLEGEMGQIYFKLEKLIGDRYIVLVILQYVFDQLMVFCLSKHNEPI